MTDLSEVLPDFDLKPWRHLIFSLEKNEITVSELITFDPVEIARRCPLPLSEVRKLINAIIETFQRDSNPERRINHKTIHEQELDGQRNTDVSCNSYRAQEGGNCVKTLDTQIDKALGGGIFTKYVTEIVGESAVGKTQFVLSLLLSAQLPLPQGLGRAVIYISTEAPLNTRRLGQILAEHPVYAGLAPSDRPTFDNIHTVTTNNLETQEHVIQFQVPVIIKQYNIGLIVIDSVAANFRAEHETNTTKGLADRAVDLVRLGHQLKRIALENDIAVVLTNQVSDRFEELRTMQDRVRSSSPLLISSPATQKQIPSSSIPAQKDELKSLDFQQRFFTGWGDRPTGRFEQLKTPALGLTWANQISVRIVLKMESDRMSRIPDGYVGGNIWKDKKKRRYLDVVFAPWVAPTTASVEYEIQLQGPVAVQEKTNEGSLDGTSSHYDDELLDPKYWHDGHNNEEEFP